MSGVTCDPGSLRSGVIEVLGHQMSGMIHSVKWIFSGTFQELNFDPGLTWTVSSPPYWTYPAQVWGFWMLLVISL